MEMLATIKLLHWWPLLLLPLPLLVYRFLPPAQNESAALQVPFFERLTQIRQQQKLGKTHSIKLWLPLSLIWVLLLIAICRPAAIGDAVKTPYEARNLLLAVDISGSMKKRDMKIEGQRVSRIEVVKTVLSEFIERRQGDRLGLILFADNAYVQVPLTYDTSTVNQFLLEARPGFAGKKTAIGDAIGLAIKKLLDQPESARTLILLTDGASNAGNILPLDAAAVARKNAIRIYTVGFGKTEENRLTKGNTSNSTSSSRPTLGLDEPTLEKVAEVTDGGHYTASDPAELETIYQILDQLEPIEQDKLYTRPQKQLFHWPLGTALLITLLLCISKLPLSRLNSQRSRGSRVSPATNRAGVTNAG